MSNLILAAYTITASLGVIILKLGTRKGLPIELINNKVITNLNLYTILGLFFYGISFILYIYLISKNDIGYIIPLAASFVYILIFFGSYLVFNEVFTPTKIIGISLILGGMIFINLNK